MKVYRVCRPSSDHFRNVISDVTWQWASQFLFPRPISGWKSPPLDLQSLEDDVAYELEMEEADENGDPERARMRYAQGPADLMFMTGSGLSLLLSHRACQSLGELLTRSGQLLPAVLCGSPVYFFHCTTLLNATSDEASRVTYLSSGNPRRHQSWR